MRCRHLDGVAFDIFQFEFDSVLVFVDDFRTFVESVGTVRKDVSIPGTVGICVFYYCRLGRSKQFPS